MLATVQAAVPFVRRPRFSWRLVPLIAASSLLALCLLFFGSPESISWGLQPQQKQSQLPPRPSPPERPGQQQQPDGDHISHQAPITDIPKQIWYKLGPTGLTDTTREWTETCVRRNPDHLVHFMSDPKADDYVKTQFRATHPELVDTFLKLQVPIWKADILRYLLLFAEGGVYLDLDVSCEQPIGEWIPSKYQGKAKLVVGWEFDVGWSENIIRQFATWTIVAAPGLPHVEAALDHIMGNIRKGMKKHNITDPADLEKDMLGDVVDATGPRAFTRGVMKSARELFKVRDQELKKLTEPKLVGDILILPGYAFAASANRYKEAFGENFKVPPPLVTHHYAGTWKNDKGGETA
ncbi:hypothetical protein VTJ49DRAFT_3426 [Mycothermus thermophilus]|uniref:Initiation-specific alpha-1,6-mannosyltransferase n=1 Tax=Humicola insolens TaxID=85995 RepID=A0ABR3V7K2_HUMIN